MTRKEINDIKSIKGPIQTTFGGSGSYLNPKYLMIGNWIENQKGQDQIVDLLCDSVNTKNGGGLYEDFDPIILTDDIIIKCGFLSWNDDGLWKYKDNEILELQTLYLEGFESHYCFRCFGIPILEIQYLHELQNIVRLIAELELNYQP